MHYFAFPEHEHIPTLVVEPTFVIRVPALVSRKLWTPILDSRLRDMRIYTASMPMPETAPNLNDFLEPGKHKIGLARKRCDVKPVPIAHAVNQAANFHLRRSSFRADVPHILGAAFWSEVVGQTTRSNGRSEMSFRRLPSTMSLTRLVESSDSSFSTVAINSGKAKW